MYLDLAPSPPILDFAVYYMGCLRLAIVKETICMEDSKGLEKKVETLARRRPYSWALIITTMSTASHSKKLFLKKGETL